MEDTDYALGRSKAEYDRLIEQAELLRPLTERVFRAAGITSGMHVLDIGCGVGDVSFLVAELVGPTGSVLGVDLDAAAIEFARQRCKARGIDNVQFQQSDARSLEGGPPFDAAVGRLVLMYVSDLTTALRLIAERVRPGGIVGFHEWDARVATASLESQPALAHLQDIIVRTFARSGARVGIGSELYRRMLDAGLEPDPRPLAEVAGTMAEYDAVCRRWTLMVRSMLPKIVEYDIASEQEIQELLRHLADELRRSPDHKPLSWLMIGQWGRKPVI